MQVNLDAIETIMCINFIRAQQRQGADARAILLHTDVSRRRPWKADEFMQQVIADDGLLTYDWDTEDAEMVGG